MFLSGHVCTSIIGLGPFHLDGAIFEMQNYFSPANNKPKLPLIFWHLYYAKISFVGSRIVKHHSLWWSQLTQL